MLKTEYGTYDGDSWEALCQKCFKIKYESDGYQEIIASPGDYGLEGFTRTGIGFQCYCPDEEYTMDELYEKQRDKITKDLKKLKTYEKQICDRLGEVKIRNWFFVSPKFKKNEILKHCSNKITEVRDWGLSFIDPQFDIQIRDIEYYLSEITQVQKNAGVSISYDNSPVIHEFVKESLYDQYITNLSRKNQKRLNTTTGDKLDKLTEISYMILIKGEDRIRNIMRRSPEIFSSLIRIINQFEDTIQLHSSSWAGTPEELISNIKNELNEIIKNDLTQLSTADRTYIVDSSISKWLALCPLDFIE